MMSKPASQCSTHSNSLPPPVSSGTQIFNDVALMHKYQSAVRAVEDTDAMQKTPQQATATRRKHDCSEADMNVSLSTECQHR